MRRYAMAIAALMMMPTLVDAQAPRQPAAGGMVPDAPSVAELLVTNREFLQLDDAQVARLGEVAAEQRAARETVRERFESLRDADRSALTQEQRAEMRAAMMTARQTEMQSHRQLRSILTVEQLGRVRRLGGALQGAARESPRGLMLGGQRGQRSQPGMRGGAGFGPRQPGMRGGAGFGPRQPGMRRGRGMAPGRPGSVDTSDAPTFENTSRRSAR